MRKAVEDAVWAAAFVYWRHGLLLDQFLEQESRGGKLSLADIGATNTLKRLREAYDDSVPHDSVLNSTELVIWATVFVGQFEARSDERNDQVEPTNTIVEITRQAIAAASEAVDDFRATSVKP